FTDATDFSVTTNDGAPQSYSIANVNHLVYDAPAGAFSNLVFSDATSSNAWSATQTFSSTDLFLPGGGFEFDSIGVSNLYLYVADTSSSATIDVDSGTGSFFAADAHAGYSYIADP